MSSPRVLAAIVVAFATAGAGCSSKSSSAPAQAAGSSDPGGSARAVAPVTKPVRPGSGGALVSGQSESSEPTDHADIRERMRAFDTDGDGKLNEDERAKMLAARAGAMLARIDSNGDGVLSKAEVDASPAAQRLGDFAAADTDHNGTLSAEEFGTAVVAAMKKAGGFRAWRGTRGDGTVPTPSPDDGGE